VNKIEVDANLDVTGGRVSFCEYIGPFKPGRYHVVMTQVEPSSMSYEELKDAIDREKYRIDSTWRNGGSYSSAWLDALNAELEKRPVPLLYCPHCGSEEAKRQLSSVTQLYHVRCNRCGSCGPSKLVGREADEAWNKRA